MNKSWNPRWLFIVFSFFMGIFLYFFYFKYVPLVTSYQLVLVPILFLVFFLTLINIEWGILFFVLVFPLINSIPYFFGIHGHIPHAPSALLLFLFFFLGWLIHHAFADTDLDFRNPVFKPLYIIAVLILVSAVITGLRYTHFFPFLSDGIYELNTNTRGVSSGGALMSTLFHSLNYLTGFLLLFVLVNSIQTKKFVKKLFMVLMISLLFSLFVGSYQSFINLSFGNTYLWEKLGQVNATFIDPNAFATFLIMIFPLILSMVFVFKGWFKVFPVFILAFSLFIYPHIGNRSSLLGLLVGVILFFIILFKKKQLFKKNRIKLIKAPVIYVLIICFLIALIIGFFSFKDSELFKRTRIVKDIASNKENLISLSPPRYFLWKEALHMGSLYPLTGVGIGAYIIELPNYYSVDRTIYKNNLRKYRRIDSAENYFLHILAELGLAGVIAFLWLFSVIIKGLVKTCKNLDLEEEYGYLQIGAAAGVVSYFPNILFHSYIGSFEVKYIFWILIAVIFSLNQIKIKPEQRKINKYFLIIASGLIVLFSAVHLWNSTHSLSLEYRTEQFDLKQNFGFYDVEKTSQGKEFRWTQKNAGKTLKVKEPILSIPLHASHPDIQKNPVKVKIFIIKGFFRETILLDEIVLEKSTWETYEYKIPAEIGEEVILLFKVSRIWNPWKTTGALDTRNLGIALGEIKFKKEGCP